MSEQKFEVIRNAPPPPERNQRGHARKGVRSATSNKYPFAELELGDAFDVPITSMWDGDGRAAEYNRLSATVSYRNRNGARQYLARMIAPNMVRCWRVA